MKIEYTHSGSTHLHHEFSMYRSLEGLRKYQNFFSEYPTIDVKLTKI